ncbi:MAG TPA: glycosyltransferase [Chitinophagaceae bacterium]|nr:glycosyltransferase [Chitinophagaceae bacterium]
MKRIPSSPPRILPISLTARPLWSVMIPVYNCAEFLTETLESVLIQALPEEKMQIEVIDDASTDADIASLVNRLGKGRIKYFRQVENVGSLRNFETCINHAHGHLVHILHGDDRVREGYYKKTGSLFENYPQAGAAFCRYSYINTSGKFLYAQPGEMNQEGILQNWFLRIAERNRIQYAAMTVRREVYEELGGFFGITYCEDWEMWVRIAKQFPVAYTPDLLADYRKHKQSITGQKFLNGTYLKDIYSAMKLIQQHLPGDQKERILKRSKKFYAFYAIRMANDLWHQTHDKKAVNASISEAFAMHKNYKMYWIMLKLYTKMFLSRK